MKSRLEKQRKINKIRSWFCEKNKIYLQLDQPRKKEDSNSYNQECKRGYYYWLYINKKGFKEIQRKLYANKLYNVDKMDKFLK